MSRHTEYVPTTVQQMERVVTLTCDSCGDEYDEEVHGTNELIVQLDPDQCVSYGHRRDFCAVCGSAIWAQICKLIGADPDSEEKTGFEDD